MGAFLAHTREEEAAADKSGMHYLALAGIDPGAMGDVLSLFDAQAALRGGYTTTHPLTRDRLRAVETTASRLTAAAPAADPAIATYWFDRLKAKLSAYLRSPSYTFRRYDGDDSDAGRIARAMAHFKNGEMDRAQAILAGLSETRPDDPFLPELRGWMQMEAGAPRAALPHYTRAVELAPDQPQILAGKGRTLLALDTAGSARDALAPLEAAYARDRRDPRLLRDLAIAYARTGETGKASLATAERYALAGRGDDATIHARRAAAALPNGSPGWARAQDIIRDAETREGR
jgi:predicted Zn-dependent protease